MKEPAKNQAMSGVATFQPLINVGGAIVDSYLKSLNLESQIKVLEALSDPIAMAMHAQLKVHVESILVGSLKLEGLTPEYVHHVRIQTLSLASVFKALVDNGQLALDGNHPILAQQKQEDSEAE